MQHLTQMARCHTDTHLGNLHTLVVEIADQGATCQPLDSFVTHYEVQYLSYRRKVHAIVAIATVGIVLLLLVRFVHRTT